MNGIPPWRDGNQAPVDNGWIGWTCDPLIWQVSAQPTSGVLFLSRVKAAQSGTVSNVDYWVATAGATLTAGQCLVGVYDTGQATAASITLLGTSADQSTIATTINQQTASIAAGVPVNANQDYYVGHLWVGTTTPALASATRFGAQGGLSGLTFRHAKYGSGLTALPATLAAASIVTTGTQYGFVLR